MARSVIESNSYGFEKANEPFIVTVYVNDESTYLSLYNPSANAYEIYDAITNQGRPCCLYGLDMTGLLTWQFNIYYAYNRVVRFSLLHDNKLYLFEMITSTDQSSTTISREAIIPLTPVVKNGSISWNISIDSINSDYSVKQTGNVVNVNINLKINGELSNTSVLLGTVSGVDLPADAMRFPCMTANNLFTSFHNAYIQMGFDGSLTIRTNDIADEYVIANFSYIV